MHVARGEYALEGEMVFLAGRQRVKFQDFKAKQIGHVARVAGVRRDAVLVDEAGVEGADERSAVLDVELEAVGFTGGQQMERRCDDDFVFRQILRRTGEIHRDVAVVQRSINELDVLTQVEEFVRLVGLLQRPVIFMAVENADLSHDLGALERRREQFEFFADLADFLVDPAGTFQMVGQDRAVKFLGAKPRLAPAEEQDGRGTAGNQLIGEHPQHARPHERIHVLPVHVAGLLLHHPETGVAIGRADAGFF